MASTPARHAGAGGEPSQPPSVGEKRLLDLLEQAPPARFAAILKCIPGWQFEGQANLRHWEKVLDKLKTQLTTALVQCPRLVVASASVVSRNGDAVADVAMSDEDERLITEQVHEALRFTAILLENASNKHLYNATETVVAFMGARSDRVAFEATHVVAALALPPQQHRHAVDPMNALVDHPASSNSALRRRLLVLAQGRGLGDNSAEGLSDFWSDSLGVEDIHSLLGAAIYQFYRHIPDRSDELVSVTLGQFSIEMLSALTPEGSAFVAGNICERLIDAFAVPSEHQFQLLVRIRSLVTTASRARSNLAKEYAAVERLNALVALFYLFSDAVDVASLVEQNTGLARGLTELIRIEKSEEVPLRVRISALQVLGALVYDRAERGGTGGILGRQSNVLQALGVAKGAPHGVFPSLVRYVLSELGQIMPKSVGSSRSRTPSATRGSDVGPSSEADNDMEMSLAVAFVQATTDLLTPEDAEVLRAGLFRDPLHPHDSNLCWFEAVLVLLNHVVSMQSGAAVLTESGVIPALLHVASSPASSAFHTSQITLCIQALEMTVNTHTAAASLYRDLNGVGIIIERLQAETLHVQTSTQNVMPLTETKTVLTIALLVMLSVSFHSQGVMSAGATSRVIRDGSPLSRTLTKILGNVDTFGPVVFAQAAIVVSDIINNDPSSVNQVHSGGIAEVFLKTVTRWDVADIHAANTLPASSELIMAIPSVLSALCLTSSHAEKVARYKPLLHLLDCFAVPSYTKDDCDHLQGDVAAIVGSGIFEMMRQVAGFQTAAIQACVETVKKLLRIGESFHLKEGNEAETKHRALQRMVTHFSDVLEPILSKSEHASAFADNGGVQCLLKLYRLVTPTASAFMSSLVTAQGGRLRLQQRKHLTHLPAAQSLTQALRSFSSHQPAKMLNAVMIELAKSVNEFREQRADILGFFSSLTDVELEELFGYDEPDKSGDEPRRDPNLLQRLHATARDIRLLTFIEWLVGLLGWSMQTAQTGLQSRHWFSELMSRTNSAILDKLFSISRSIQLERSNLVGAHRTSHAESMSGNTKSNGLWKLCSLLLLRFATATRGLLVSMSKTFISVPIQHRRGEDSPHSLASHAHTMAQFIAKTLRDHIRCALPAEDPNIGSPDPFVKKYYLLFVLETVMQTLFDSKKKQANSLIMSKLIFDSTAGRVSQFSCVHSMITYLCDNLLEADGSFENGESSRLDELCLRACTNALQHIGDLETLRTSQITVALVSSEDDDARSDRARFDLRKFSVRLHRECLDLILRLWQQPHARSRPIEKYAQELLPAVVMVLRHRLDQEESSQASSSTSRNPFDLHQGNRARGRHDMTPFGDFPGGGVLDREDFLQALFGGGGHPARSRSTNTRPFEVDSATVDSLVAMGFPRGRVERAIRRVRVNDVEVAMEWLLTHPDADDDADEADSGTATEDSGLPTRDANTGNESTNAEGTAPVVENQVSDEERSLYASYFTLRDGFEERCFDIIRHQTSMQVSSSTTAESSLGSGVQIFTVMLAQYLALLSSKVDDERQRVVLRVGNALTLSLSNADEPDRYVMALSHLLAVILQLDSESVGVLMKQLPALIDNILEFVRNGLDNAAKMRESYSPLLLIVDAIQVSDTASQSAFELKAEDSNSTDAPKLSVSLRSEIVRLAVKMMECRGLQRSTTHALWQLLVHLTLDYEVASELYAAGGLEKLLDIPEEAVFPGYKELTGVIFVQMLESPQVLEQMMEEKIRQAMTKLSERYGPPSQMRITPRVLMMEVASVAARSEKIFQEALKKAVLFKRTESGRVYVLTKSIESGAALPGDSSSSATAEDNHNDKKVLHKLPKSHRQHAQAVVHKLVEKIYEVWCKEKLLPDTESIDAESKEDEQASVSTGTYLHVLVQVVSTFPACAAVLSKPQTTTGLAGHDDVFIHVALREFLPCRALCQFSTIRRALDGNRSVEDSITESRLKDSLTSRTRERLKNSHKLLVAVGTQPGDGPKVIVGELVKLFQAWPQSVSPGVLTSNDLAVDDELALSALHAWSALIMSILWPRGSASKTLSWDKVVLGGGLTGKYAFVTLLVDALRKISLSHPFAHSTCMMLLRPLTTLTRPFVTHRVKKLLLKRNTQTSAEPSVVEAEEPSSSSSGPDAGAPDVVDSSMELDNAETQPSETGGGHDVDMQSPERQIDHEMSEHDSDDGSDRSSVSAHSVDDGGRRGSREHEDHEHDEDEEEDEDEEDDDEEDDDEGDEDEDDSGDEDGDEEMEEEEGRIRLRVIRRNQDGSSRSRGGRTWGSLEHEGGDGYDEVDEEEFSYLRLIDEESIITRTTRLRQSRTTRSSEQSGTGGTGGTLARSLIDVLGLDAGQGTTDPQAGIFAFGDDDDDEDDPDMAFRHGGGSLRDSGVFVPSPGEPSQGGATLLALLEDQPGENANSDFIFETVDVGHTQRSSRSRGVSVSESFGSPVTSLLHPLLQHGDLDNSSVSRGADGSSGLLPDRVPLPRHAPSLFRELNVLVRQMNNNLHLAPGARTLLGRDLLRQGGGRTRPPSRNRLSAVSNLLSEFSLDIPTSQGIFGHGRSAHHRSAGAVLRRGDRELLGGSRGLRGDMGMDSAPTWAGHGSASDVRSIATRLEQFAAQLVEPDVAPSDQPNSPQERQQGAADATETAARGEPGDGTTAASSSSTSGLASDEAGALRNDAGRDSAGQTVDLPGQVHANDATSDSASVVALASTLGESSLRSPQEEVESESEMPSSPMQSSLPAPPPVDSSSSVPPPAPVASSAGDLMNFTLDLSSFQQSSLTQPLLTTQEAQNTDSNVVEDEMKSEEESNDVSSSTGGLVCPEGVDPEVFAFLPPEMQAEIVAQHAPPPAPSQSQGAAPAVGSGDSESYSQMDLDMANSSFDRETLEALPPDIRAEVLANERREREEAARAAAAPADISRAEEMDNASFVASLAPGLREEILTTCDDAFLQTLPSQVQAEAMVLRERAAYRPVFQESAPRRTGGHGGTADDDTTGDIFRRPTLRRMLTSHGPDIFSASARRSGRVRHGDGSNRGRGRDERSITSQPGKIRVPRDEEEGDEDRILQDKSVQAILRLLFMAQSIVQNRVIQRLLTNVCLYPVTRRSVRSNLLRILSTPLEKSEESLMESDDFPPKGMYGASASVWSPSSPIPPEVLGRVFSVMVSLTRHNSRFALDMLQIGDGARKLFSHKSGAEILLELLEIPAVNRSAMILETLLELIELVLSPLDHFKADDAKSNDGDETKEDDAAPSASEWIRVPEVTLDARRLGNVVSVLTLNICSPSMQERTIQILKLLDRVPTNRPMIMQALVREGKILVGEEKFRSSSLSGPSSFEASAVLKSAQDELKLLRILHTLSDVCETTSDFTECCASIGLDALWEALSKSLDEARVGSTTATDAKSDGTVGVEGANDGVAEDDQAGGMVIEGKSAGASCAMAALLARFLPMVEAFFVVSARDAASMPLRVPDSAEREEAVVTALREGGLEGVESMQQSRAELKRVASTASETGDSIQLANFVEANRVLLNLLVREKPSLLDSSLAALVKLPRCRAYLDFDNKRTYFQSAMKKLRQTALRSQVGNAAVRLSVRRDHIFEDSYYALRMRSGAELRRKLHISFTGEEGIDAGGVTREWYVILAREIFNPNYVLFTSAADSPTFQPNPLSYVNKDHLSYFEFVGKVIGKAVADGQLLDAHFTRSFYKHMLQLPISYHDMEAIDPEYYRNLHSILDNSIEDLGLELTFSADQSNFGRVEIVDLIPNGRNIPVTDENKMEYVKLVTHHRMATGIRQQIDAFLKGFHQLVPPEMISIFNENELELLISGMPEIDIDDLKANTDYANYKPTDPVIRWFWNVLYACSHEERALFLQFVTGTSKVPLEGFKALEGMRGTHKFNIHKAFGNPNALPSAHTCFNQLDLPEYESEEKLRQCLLLAIREGSEGFGFG